MEYILMEEVKIIRLIFMVVQQTVPLFHQVFRHRISQLCNQLVLPHLFLRQSRLLLHPLIQQTLLHIFRQRILLLILLELHHFDQLMTWQCGIMIMHKSSRNTLF
eukprot:UN03106